MVVRSSSRECDASAPPGSAPKVATLVARVDALRMPLEPRGERDSIDQDPEMKPVKIFGIAGSLRRTSYNRATLRAAMQLLPEDASIDVFELDGIPGFSEDDEKSPPAKIVDMKKRIRAADAVLIVTPEYNYSIPGVLKNAIDWASRPYGDSAWNGKPVAIMGASIGAFGTMRAQYHLRQCFVFLNMEAVLQ